MCYGYHRLELPDGRRGWISEKDLRKLPMWEQAKIRGDGWQFARDMAPVLLEGGRGAVMRFDLVPRWYLQREGLPLAETLKRKQSRAKGQRGFDSYNARSESVRELPSFRAPWAEGKRCVVQVDMFRERPNMDEAPKEFRGKEYNVHLDAPRFAAGLWDRWERGEEALESFAILTVDSAGNDVLRGIWHERCPVLLTEAEALEWVDPKTPLDRAAALCRLLDAEHMDARLVPRKPKEGGEGA
jgi:putative SOS response-associated peptidase YedK